MKKNKEKQNFNVLDERQMQIVQKAGANGYIFLLVYLVVISFYKIVVGGDPIWELLGVFGSAIIVIVSRRLLGDVEQPVDYLNRPLPTGNSKDDKSVRIKNYTIKSVMFGLGFAVMDVILLLSLGYEFLEHEFIQEVLPNISGPIGIAISAAIVLVVGFIISFIFEYLAGEFYDVRRYNKLIAELDREEND